MEPLLKSGIKTTVMLCNRAAFLPERLDVSQIRRWKHLEKANDRPVKFTTSEAYVGYKAARNFYGDDRELPNSHNYVLSGTGIFAFFYLIFLRDEVDEGGALGILRPLHETVPELAIPLLQATIAENRKYGQDTSKLEKKLAEYMKDVDKHGGGKPKLIEN